MRHRFCAQNLTRTWTGAAALLRPRPIGGRILDVNGRQSATLPAVMIPMDLAE